MTRVVVREDNVFALRAGRMIPLPWLAAGHNTLYDRAGQRVAVIEFTTDNPDRVEQQIALTELFAALTQGLCPGCGQHVRWRCLGYQHEDQAAPSSGPGWVTCEQKEKPCC